MPSTLTGGKDAFQYPQGDDPRGHRYWLGENPKKSQDPLATAFRTAPGSARARTTALRPVSREARGMTAWLKLGAPVAFSTRSRTAIPVGGELSPREA